MIISVRPLKLAEKPFRFADSILSNCLITADGGLVAWVVTTPEVKLADGVSFLNVDSSRPPHHFRMHGCIESLFNTHRLAEVSRSTGLLFPKTTRKTHSRRRAAGTWSSAFTAGTEGLTFRRSELHGLPRSEEHESLSSRPERIWRIPGVRRLIAQVHQACRSFKRGVALLRREHVKRQSWLFCLPGLNGSCGWPACFRREK